MELKMIMGILAGTAWGLANLYLIKYLLESFLLKKSSLGFYTGLLVKFPLLYGIGYGLLQVVPPLSLLIGFPLSFTAIVRIRQKIYE